MVYLFTLSFTDSTKSHVELSVQHNLKTQFGKFITDGAWQCVSELNFDLSTTRKFNLLQVYVTVRIFQFSIQVADYILIYSAFLGLSNTVLGTSWKLSGPVCHERFHLIRTFLSNIDLLAPCMSVQAGSVVMFCKRT